MELYHYIPKGNTALTEGIISFALQKKADLSYYYKRFGATTHEGVVQWMEGCFVGRSRGIRAFSEPICWTEKSLHLKRFVDNADMFVIDIDGLAQGGWLDAVYLSPSIMDYPDLREESGMDELLIKLHSWQDIEDKPVDWTVCDEKLGRRFAYIPYYLLIIKGGIILPKYLRVGQSPL